MATSNQDFAGLLGDIFGGGGGATGLEEYLTAAQTGQMNRQALLQAAIAASQASAPSTTPKNFMQILGAGLAGGQQGYQQAQQGALAQLLAKQKLDEYKRKQALQTMLTKGLFGDQTAPTMATEPQTQFPMAGEVITPMQSQVIGGLPCLRDSHLHHCQQFQYQPNKEHRKIFFLLYLLNKDCWWHQTLSLYCQRFLKKA